MIREQREGEKKCKADMAVSGKRLSWKSMASMTGVLFPGPGC